VDGNIIKVFPVTDKKTKAQEGLKMFINRVVWIIFLIGNSSDCIYVLTGSLIKTWLEDWSYYSWVRGM